MGKLPTLVTPLQETGVTKWIFTTLQQYLKYVHQNCVKLQHLVCYSIYKTKLVEFLLTGVNIVLADLKKIIID